MAVALILRMMVATLSILIVGTIAVFAMQFIEPIGAVLSTPDALGWADPFDAIGGVFVAAVVGLMLVITIWLITAPVPNDRRQQIRRP